VSADLAELLPPTLAGIAEVIGVDAALRLAAAWPGQRLYVPEALEPEHPIAQAIGYEAGLRFVARYAREYMLIPAAVRLQKMRLRAKVLAEVGSGRSAAEVSREYGLHIQTIWKWQAQQAPDDRQASLF
jgi:hypothetical protein